MRVGIAHQLVRLLGGGVERQGLVDTVLDAERQSVVVAIDRGRRRHADCQCLHKRIARSAGSQLVPYMSGLTIVLVCCGVVLVAMVLGRNENDLD